MTTISRLNTTIDNHYLAAGIIAFGLLASVSAISAAAIEYNGQLAKATYDVPVATTPASKPIAKSAAKPLTLVPTAGKTVTIVPTAADSAPLAVQGQPNSAAYLQPAGGASSTYGAYDLQPSVKAVQLTDAAPQNAMGL